MPITKRAAPITRRSISRTMALAVLVPLSLAWPSIAMADDNAKPVVPPVAGGIDPAILAEMNRQASLQPAVDALQEAALDAEPGFAGVAYEGDGLTLYYKGTPTPKMSAALARARAFGTIKVARAAHARDELQRDSNKITARAVREGSDIQAVSLATDGSGLTVEIMPAATAADNDKKRTAKGLKPLKPARDIVTLAVVDVPVRFTEAKDPIDLMACCHRSDDRSPWNGGSRWESWRNGAARRLCTTGFGVKNGAGERFVLTAAHCATPPDYGRQGEGSTLEYIAPVYQQAVSADLLIMRANGSSLIFEGGFYSSTTRYITGWAHWAANQLVCQSGATSAYATGNTVCGLRQQNSTDIVFACCDSDGDQGYTINGVIRTTKDGGGTAVRGGDSGGPVYTISGSNGTAKGIVSAGSGNTMYFQDWADVGRIWGLSPY